MGLTNDTIIQIFVTKDLKKTLKENALKENRSLSNYLVTIIKNSLRKDNINENE